ncbi:adhesion G protein-coupled receptor E5 isoform X2 [Rana temporaria]|uniref:adhesion G protein-coupled receptor E5 isoform X2 n=1 Tax=Rana temporaria TaxID=8407 RepID=UPI001AACCD7E|nr:adhesion G protein-coupled receptor E5 isoform X2 [Rana temporaria]
MEYWIRIGLTTAMMIVISALSSAETATIKPNQTATIKPDQNITGKNKEGSATTALNSNLTCRKPVTDGTECPGNKKCPVNDECDDSSQCPCMDGYRSYNDTVGNISIITCEDIHECIDHTHTCGIHTNCNNSEGGYFCVCNKGFRRGNETKFCPTNGRENGCADIDECKEDPNICGPNSICENIGGSYQCDCIRGFTNSSNNCTVLKRCRDNFKICGLKGICNSTKGSINCSCQEGYKAVSMGFEYPQCNVRCKQEDEIKPACDSTKPRCTLDRFADMWKPLCNDRNPENFDVDKLLDGLDDMISKFFNQNKGKKERLQLVGKFLNTVEGIVQNLAHIFSRRMPLSNKKNFISAVTTNRTSTDKKISLSNRNSSISIDRITALGDAYTSVLGCLEYGNINKLLEGAELQNNSQNHTVKLVSSVVSVFLGIANTSKLSEPIQLQLNFTDEEVTPNKTHCAFWSAMDAAWSTEGCETLERDDYGVLCSCTHLTSFAVLMALDNLDITESWTLSLMTTIGLSISIVCLSAAIITFCLCRFLRGTRNTIHIHLCVSLLIGHSIFLIGVEATTNKVVCGVVAGLLHFFYLSAFCWMSLEGLELYLMLVTVFKTQVKTRYLLAMGYGVPTAIVIISAAVFPKGYGTEKHCWLCTKHNFIWSFMGPVCVIILINCGIFVMTVWKLAKKMTAINPEQGKLKHIRSLTVTSVAQLCILGCCWAFGFLMFGKTALVFAYAFTICNVLQGVQIFVLHCLMNKKVREKYVEAICALAHFRSPLYSEFSNSSNVNTQSRAKASKESGL